jgi:hypothetical protein
MVSKKKIVSTFLVDIVPNRTIESLTEFFRRIISPGTTMVTGGYPSYPVTAGNLRMEHLIVNHYNGFTD